MTMISIIINPIHHTANSFSTKTTTIISSPASADDYRQLASLLVSSFDAPQCSKEEDDNTVSKIQRLQWDLYERSFTEEFTYKRYVSTARRMRGKKYCLLVAKQNDEGVVGMVEMGMSFCPVDINVTTTTTLDDGFNPNE